MAFVKVARTAEIAPGAMKLVVLGGQQLVVANVGGIFAAFANECTHSGGPLEEGELAGDVVVCPWHASGFNVRSGKPVSGPAAEPIQVYEVRVEGDAILVAEP